LFLPQIAILIFEKEHDHPRRKVSIFLNERIEDQSIPTTDCGVAHSDLSIDRCGSQT